MEFIEGHRVRCVGGLLGNCISNGWFQNATKRIEVTWTGLLSCVLWAQVYRIELSCSTFKSLPHSIISCNTWIWYPKMTTDSSVTSHFHLMWTIKCRIRLNKFSLQKTSLVAFERILKTCRLQNTQTDDVLQMCKYFCVWLFLYLLKQAGLYCHPIYSKEGGRPANIEKLIENVSLKEGYEHSRLPKFTDYEKNLVKGI